MKTQSPWPLGKVAAKFGVTQRQVRNLYLRGILPEPERCGAYRVVPVDDLPAVRDALIVAGYLKVEKAGAVPA